MRMKRAVWALLFILFIFSTSEVSSQPLLGKDHGFFSSSFALSITGKEAGSKIYYTIDGSFPSAIHGTLYSTPLTISKTSVIRAVEVVNGTPGKIATATYIFPDDVIRQPNNPSGYPAKWGPYTGISGQAIADYEMDPELMADPAFAAEARAALLAIPTISIVTNRNYIFSNSQNPDTGGIYIYTGSPLTNTTNGIGFGWERPASFEIFDPKDSISLQVDCGVRLEGGHSRRPEKNPKHSFRLVFRSEYGPKKLDFPLFGHGAVSEFNTIILRANFGNTWVHWSVTERQMASYLNDRWAKDTHMAMGYPGSHGFYAHLYINGIYWGVYNPSERFDADFAESYLMGDASDLDIIKDYGEVADGNITAWNAMMITANAGLSDEAGYQKFIGNKPDGTRDPKAPAMVDPVSLADYMLLNFYGGNWDWDHHNWVAMRNRINPGRGFTFYSWDEEHMIETVDANILNENNANCPSRIYQQLMKNATFRRLVADRIQKLCFNGGPLTPASGLDRWEKRATELEEAIVDESARWGDYRRDVHPWQTGPYDLYTRSGYWDPERIFMEGTYFPGRTDAFIATLRTAGLFPSVNAPLFMINGASVKSKVITGGEMLTMSAPGSVIYFTTDGSDPVDWQNNPLPSKNAKMYSAGLKLDGSLHVKARAYKGNVWSATSEQFFILRENYNDLKITEINYNPENNGSVDGRRLEFIELKNTGSSTLDMGGLKVSGGIEYLFHADVPLKPGEFIVLASDPGAFTGKYWFLPHDMYKGQLSNDGERLIVETSDNDTIIDVEYSNKRGWPSKADGQGYSVVPVDKNPAGNQSVAENWRASYLKGGSPGKDDLLLAESRVSDILVVYQNYPNPFSASTCLSFDLLQDADVTIEIFNAIGIEVKRIDRGRLSAGSFNIEWNASGDNNILVSSGIYYWRIKASNWKLTSVITGKMTVLR
jgi:hypothetical protein